MTDQKCCENADRSGCSHGGHGMMMLECCQEHKMSRAHLEAKKKMLEEKLKCVNEKLGDE